MRTAVGLLIAFLIAVTRGNGCPPGPPGPPGDKGDRGPPGPQNDTFAMGIKVYGTTQLQNQLLCQGSALFFSDLTVQGVDFFDGSEIFIDNNGHYVITANGFPASTPIDTPLTLYGALTVPATAHFQDGTLFGHDGQTTISATGDIDAPSASLGTLSVSSRATLGSLVVADTTELDDGFIHTDGFGTLWTQSLHAANGAIVNKLLFVNGSSSVLGNFVVTGKITGTGNGVFRGNISADNGVLGRDLTVGGSFNTDTDQIRSNGQGDLTVEGTVTVGEGLTAASVSTGSLTITGPMTLLSNQLHIVEATTDSEFATFALNRTTNTFTIGIDGVSGVHGLTNYDVATLTPTQATLPGKLTVVGGISFDGGAVTTNGNGSLVIDMLNSDDGKIFTSGSGLLTVGLMTVTSGPLNANAGISTTTLTASGAAFLEHGVTVTGAASSFDNGKITTDNFGQLTIIQLHSDKGGVVTDGNGDLTVLGVAALNGGTTTTTLTASGAATLNGGTTTTTLTVSGVAHLNGGATTATFNASGLANFNGGATATTLKATSLTVTGASLLEHGVAVSGAASSFDGNLITTDNAGRLTVVELHATSTSTISGALFVEGSSTGAYSGDGLVVDFPTVLDNGGSSQVFTSGNGDLNVGGHLVVSSGTQLDGTLSSGSYSGYGLGVTHKAALDGGLIVTTGTGTLQPATDLGANLGAPTKRWNSIYVKTIHANYSTVSATIVDGQDISADNLDVGGITTLDGNKMTTTGFGIFQPTVDLGASLGTTTHRWKNLFVETMYANFTHVYSSNINAVDVVANNIVVDGTATMNGPVTLNDGLTVLSGTTTIDGPLVINVPLTGPLVITYAADATALGLGALRVTGGTSINKTLQVGGKAVIQGSLTAGAATVTSLTNTGSATTTGTSTAGAFTTAGTVTANAVKITGTTDSTVLGVGSLVAYGGGSFNKTLRVGTNAYVTGSVNAASVSATGAVSSASVSATGAISGNTVSATGAVTGGSLVTAGTLSSGAATVSSLSSTGAVNAGSLTVTGKSFFDNNKIQTDGNGNFYPVTDLGGNLGSLTRRWNAIYVKSNYANFTGVATKSLNSTNIVALNLLVQGTLTTQGSATFQNGLTVTAGTTNIEGPFVTSGASNTFTNHVKILDTTQASSLGTGALIVYGGASFNKSVQIGGNAVIAGTLTAGATTVTSLTDTGNAAITGTLSAGAATVSSLSSSGAVSGTTGTFTSITDSGSLSAVNTAISGTLTTTGASNTFSGHLKILDTTDATAIGTGALQVYGGASFNKTLRVGGSAFVGGSETITGSLTVNGITNSGSSTTTGSVSAGSFTTAGSLTVNGITNSGSSTITGALSAGSISTTGTLTAASFTSSSAANTATQHLKITDTTDATVLGVGSLVAYGGASFNKTLRVGGSTFIGGSETIVGSLTVNGITNSGSSSTTGSVSAGSFTTTGTLTVHGITNSDSSTTTGTASAGAFSTTGTVTANAVKITGTTDSTVLGVGSLVAYGGGSFNKTLRVGGNAVVSGSLTVSGVTNTGSLTVVGITNTGSESVTGALTAGTVTSTGTLTGPSFTSSSSANTATKHITITSTTDATVLGTGALQVGGGASFNKTLRVGGNTFIGGSETITGSLTVNGVTNTGSNTITGSLTAGSISTAGTFSGASFTSSSSANTATQHLKITDTTDATVLGTGSLQVGGGASINKTLIVGGNTNIKGTLTVNGQSITGGSSGSAMYYSQNAAQFSTSGASFGYPVSFNLPSTGSYMCRGEAVYSNAGAGTSFNIGMLMGIAVGPTNSPTTVTGSNRNGPITAGNDVNVQTIAAVTISSLTGNANTVSLQVSEYSGSKPCVIPALQSSLWCIAASSITNL